MEHTDRGLPLSACSMHISRQNTCTRPGHAGPVAGGWAKVGLGPKCVRTLPRGSVQLRASQGGLAANHAARHRAPPVLSFKCAAAHLKDPVPTKVGTQATSLPCALNPLQPAVRSPKMPAAQHSTRRKAWQAYWGLASSVHALCCCIHAAPPTWGKPWALGVQLWRRCWSPTHQFSV
jgi:hypothetical protein